MGSCRWYRVSVLAFPVALSLLVSSDLSQKLFPGDLSSVVCDSKEPMSQESECVLWGYAKSKF